MADRKTGNKISSVETSKALFQVEAPIESSTTKLLGKKGEIIDGLSEREAYYATRVVRISEGG